MTTNKFNNIIIYYNIEHQNPCQSPIFLWQSDNEIFEGIEEWVQTKLKGRYCLVRYPAIDQDGNLKSNTFLGLEDQKELTYFMLACTNLRRN